MKTRTALLAVAPSLGAALVVAQGPLTPPGAPAPTMKTLDQVEARTIVNATNTPGDTSNLFIISQPGSYYLTGNVTGVASKDGIRINTSGVTLDLNGFALSGLGTSFAGVFCWAGATRVAIVNGTITGWPLDGVDASLSTNGRFEKLIVSGNGNSATRAGIRTGQAAVVRDCVASGGHKIEGNNVGLNYRGIDVLSVRNVIVRNIAGANSNADYSIVGGNTQGPIVNVADVGDISGTVGANTPMANYQY